MDRLLSRAPLGIRFADYLFTHPMPLDRISFSPRSSGLYVLLMPDTTWGPWHFQPLFFGEFASGHPQQMNQAQQICCLRVSGGRSLYYALYHLPHPNAWAVAEIKNELVARYRPIANLFSADGGAALAQRLETLEKKISEQDAVLKLVLAALGQTGQFQQPEPRKRIAGFRPDPARSRRDAITATDKPR
jgi:hypothetical protein